MNISDLKVSDSTKGMLEKRGYTIQDLVESRSDLTELKGIGASRAIEIDRALDEAFKEAVVSKGQSVAEIEEVATEEFDEVIEEVYEEPSADEPAEKEPERPLAPSPPETKEGDLVRFVDRSMNLMLARVASVNELDLHLQVFTGAGGSYRVESVPRGGQFPEPHRWFPREKVEQ